MGRYLCSGDSPWNLRTTRRRGEGLETSTRSSLLPSSLRAEAVFQPLGISRTVPDPLPDDVSWVAKDTWEVTVEARGAVLCGKSQLPP